MSRPILRSDYQAPAWLVKHVELAFDLHATRTHVANRICLYRNPAVAPNKNPLYLHGEQLELLQLRLNGQTLSSKEFKQDKHGLTIFNPPEKLILEIETRINPQKNTALNGLYLSKQLLVTQCEAEGFRRITFFPDRPDVMTRYTVMLRANKKDFPVLLSNGNLIKQGDIDKTHHYAKWEDPFAKPSYLFALVAGNLVCKEKKLRLSSGKKVLLQVWTTKDQLDKTAHALEALECSILWDQHRFDLELDLERFMLVAVDDFNMGAMENKGLNIFNSKYILASKDTATDLDYANIEAIVGHEYFHNWTGNRVTCRDWFQLSLKEGLTVFREQEFVADMIGSRSGRAVERIQNVRLLRRTQFTEDAGPMAHPIRPDSYFEINNFYTATVYEKGAEVVRMLQTLVGVEGFRRGMDLYFARHDGQAVTCDDFRLAMADANKIDLSQFERWYDQAGTPHLHIKTHYDAQQKKYTLHCKQSLPRSQNSSKRVAKSKEPVFVIPIAVGLLDAQGKEMPLNKKGDTTLVLSLTEKEQCFEFEHVHERPIPSLLRNFSAPVILHTDHSDEDALHLLKYDSDAFNRWEIAQTLMIKSVLSELKCPNRLNLKARFSKKNQPTNDNDSLNQNLINALREVLRNKRLSPGLRDQILTLPDETTIGEQLKYIHPLDIQGAVYKLRRQIAVELRDDFLQSYLGLQEKNASSMTREAAAKRALKNTALQYLLECKEKEFFVLAYQQYQHSDNMTDRLASLTGLVNTNAPQKKTCAQRFL